MGKQIIKLNDPDGFDQLEKAYRDMEENEGLQLKRIGKDIKRILPELYKETFEANDFETLEALKTRCMQLRRRMKNIIRIRNGSHLGFRLVKPEAQKLIDGYLEELKESEELIVQKIKMLEIESKTIQPEASKEKLFNEKRIEFEKYGFFELKMVKSCKDPEKLLEKILGYKAKTKRKVQEYQVGFLEYLKFHNHIQNVVFPWERAISGKLHLTIQELIGSNDIATVRKSYGLIQQDKDLENKIEADYYSL